MGGQWRQVLPAFLMFSYIFTWIKYYKYFHLDFSAGLLTNVRATGDGWELYPQPGLEPEGPRRFLHCWICRVLWDCRYDLRIVTSGTGARFYQCRRPNLIIQAEMYLGWLNFVILCVGMCVLLPRLLY